MARETNIVCCGSAVLDHVFRVTELPARPEKVPASDHWTSAGGMAATAAAAIAALGGRASFWSVLGDDGAGDTLRAAFAASGVDTRHVSFQEGAVTPVSAVLLDDHGERLLAFYPGHRAREASEALPIDDLRGADAVLADIRWPEGARAVLEAAKETGVPSILDVDTFTDPSISDLIGLCDHAIFSRAGLRSATGCGEVDDGLRAAKSLARGVVGVTLGSSGFAWLESGSVSRQDAFEVEVKDTNGAGDVFHGAYALLIGEGADVRTAARFANAAGALKCTRGGGWSEFPARAAVENLLNTRTP